MRLALAAGLTAAAGLCLTVYGAAAPPYLRPPGPATTVSRQTPAIPAAGRPSPSRRAPGTAPAPASPRAPAGAVPADIAVPALDISSALGPARGLRADGTVDDAPLSGPTWSLPWWYAGGPAPGQAGSAVILGHVDSAAGAGHLGVFFRLGALRAGQQIAVTSAGAAVTHWTVTSSVSYLDAQFPDAVVYDRAGPPMLRLVTCGGSFDRHTHHYRAATVVTARPTPTS